jgi:cytochrome c
MKRVFKNGLVILFWGFIFVIGCVDNSKNQTKNPGRDSTTAMVKSPRSIGTDSLLFYKGKVIFKTDCNKCHVARGKDDNYLEGVVQRMSEDYLKLYLTGQDSLVSVKDSIALRLKRVWENQSNSHNFAYSGQELKAIVEYLK